VDEPGQPFQLMIHHQLENNENVVQINTIKATCQADALASPISWVSTTQFEDRNGNLNPSLKINETAHVHDHEIQMLCNNHLKKIAVARPITSDLCLMEAVQRLPVSLKNPLSFDMLELFSRNMRNQTLTYRGESTEEWKHGPVKTHVFQQWGHGVLPYEYYLDEHHRLLVAITGYRAYIRDENAEKTFRTKIQKRRARQGGKP
jgi:hypothetical protein